MTNQAWTNFKREFTITHHNLRESVQEVDELVGQSANRAVDVETMPADATMGPSHPLG